MKIEITGCSSPMYWYRDNIGEVFEVLKEEKSRYIIEDRIIYTRWVEKTDCTPYKEDPKTKREV